MAHYWNEFWPAVLSVAFLVGVAGNLAASLLWGLPAFIHLHRKLDRQHAERMAQGEQLHRAVASREGST
jgi:hypothetical protein